LQRADVRVVVELHHRAERVAEDATDQAGRRAFRECEHARFPSNGAARLHRP
jgi:hypothetical protein